MAGPRAQNRRPFTAELQVMKRLDGLEALATQIPAGATGGGTSQDVIDAIHDLKQSLVTDIREMLESRPAAGGSSPSPADGPSQQEIDEVNRRSDELRLVKNEIRALSVCIQQTKDEIAALYRSQGETNRLNAVSDELGGIVQDTEKATARILEHVEHIDHAAQNIRSAANDTYITGAADEVLEHVVQVFESCNFQDLTGQRINKVVNTLRYIDERIHKVIEIWGDEDFLNLDAEEDPRGQDNLERMVSRTREETEAERISQDDIDKLFD